MPPPKKPSEPVNTALLPSHKPAEQGQATPEGFIGHEAPTRVDIDLTRIGLVGGIEKTAMAPALVPAAEKTAMAPVLVPKLPKLPEKTLLGPAPLPKARPVEKTTVGALPVDDVTPPPADDVTPPPEEGERLTVAFLEELCGVPLPARLTTFFEAEVAQHEGARHPDAGDSLHFLSARLEPLWSQATQAGVDLPSGTMVPIAAVGQLAMLIAIDLEEPELPAYRFSADDGFVLISAAFDDFVSALPAPAP